MKTILCYGDSNTWGCTPGTGERYDQKTRWPGVLGSALGKEYAIIEEGLPGRTTVWDDPIEGYKNGKKYLIPCLESHKPLNLVIIFLGTNDLKTRFSLSSYDISEGAGVLVRLVQNSLTGIGEKSPEVLLLAPPKIGRLSGDGPEILDGAAEKAEKFSFHFRRVATQLGCHFLDTANFIVSSELDGVHLDASEHQKLGSAVAEMVREIFGEAG